jgi:nucleolysin TIA-1/TIAR
MSDNGPPPPGSQLLPPPQSSAGAPGYENGQNGQHMPPPTLPPVIIPQNTNPIPTAITSPMGENGGMMSPDSQGGFARRAAPEPNKRALYVGGLDPRVTEDVLRQIFETTGHVQNVKIIPDKNVGAVSIISIFVTIPENPPHSYPVCATCIFPQVFSHIFQMQSPTYSNILLAKY